MTRAPLNPADESFAARLPEGVRRPLTPGYLEERRGFFRGRGGVLVAPRSTEETARLVRLAAKARVGIVPYGGGTGLVGGQVMPDGPLPMILSLERMRAIRGLWPEENAMAVEAGAVLADIQAAAAEAGRLFPLSLGAEGSCRIGGNLATNAGGVNVLRYGNTRELCLGLEAVLPDGSIWNGMKRLRKDNTGYDLRGLMIGSEGTLGIITAAVLRLFPRPAREAAALISVESPAAALALLALTSARVGPGLTAFELISGQGLHFLEETGCPARSPLRPVPGWAVLIDLGLGPEDDPEMALAELFEAAEAAGLAHDGVIGTGAKRARLWQMREQIPEANRRIGAISSHDISLPLSAIPDFLRAAPERVARLGRFRINAFGHLGDGNLHFNVFPTEGGARSDYPPGTSAELATAIYDLVAEFDGSFSAEHGVGRLKAGDLVRYGDPAKLAAMGAIKAALDPQGIMNPGVMGLPDG
ncbi:MAG: hydroxyacid dehydrogenase [Rhodobacterales bacterium]|nr:MAG: hydroxyacid dehydrogenase [Rhodobacterales bacterium]